MKAVNVGDRVVYVDSAGVEGWATVTDVLYRDDPPVRLHPSRHTSLRNTVLLRLGDETVVTSSEGWGPCKWHWPTKKETF